MKRFSNTLCGILAVYSLSAQSPTTVSDADGNKYPTVVIGNQEWMAENLRTTLFNDGKSIPLVGKSGRLMSSYSPAYSWYMNDKNKYEYTYGALYNWYAVSTGKLCPSGWHVPTDEEWSELTGFLGGKETAGGKLKSTVADNVRVEISESELDREKPTYVPGEEVDTQSDAPAQKVQTGWNSPNEGATNESRFSALPGGHSASGSSSTTQGFENKGSYGYWWTSTESSPGVAWYRMMYYDHSNISRFTIGKNDGNSLRCVRD